MTPPKLGYVGRCEVCREPLYVTDRRTRKRFCSKTCRSNRPKGRK